MTWRTNRIGVDVDGVVTPTDEMWYNWCRHWFDEDVTVPIDYNLLLRFCNNKDIMQFWKQDDLYQNVPINPDCREVLQSLHDLGNEIVFVSRITDPHGHSKWDFLKDNFPFMKGVMWTREKWLAGVDVMIDDKLSTLNLCATESGMTCLHYQTRFIERGVNPVKGIHKVTNWLDIHKLLGE